MKTAALLALCWLMALIFAWLFGSFAEWELSPENWGSEARVACALLWSALVGVTTWETWNR